MFKRVSGTKDILPDEISGWQKLEEKSRRVFSLYNYREIRPPLIEEEPLFNRSLGQSSEIVQKQMFLIKNKEETYALRPEGTASIARAYIENNLDKTNKFVKLYYMGPMFRLERPQKGRLRQFYHIGCEAIGSSSPELDVEVISLAEGLLKEFSLSGYKINLNNLGCAKDKAGLAKILRNSLKEELTNLCEDCKLRFQQNVLRILDCKKESCRRVVEKIDLRDDHLCIDCREHFQRVKEGLDSLGIRYYPESRLVRGLDYYTRTVFEITHPDLGSQDALGAGGRYDNLVKELGGPDTGAIGFAFGVERLLLARANVSDASPERLVYLISLGEEARKQSEKLIFKLRNSGIPCDTDYEGKSLKGAMRQANDSKARFVLVLGDDEIKKGVVSLKDMENGEQREVPADKIIEELKC